MDRPLPWLRYLDADDLETGDLDFDGLKVRDDAGNKLGSVDGFIVDVNDGRPYYVVVDSGGWFKSKDFLLPIGHARIDNDRDALVADVPKERIDRFPGFDKDNFEKLSEDEWRRMNDAICGACSVTAVSYTDTALASTWNRSDYRQPDWWKYDTSRWRTDTRPAASTGTSASAAADRDRGKVDREAVVAHSDDVSPHMGGRAQPGDVIGVETGGEQTHIGETTDDENKRRRDAEESVRKSRQK